MASAVVAVALMQAMPVHGATISDVTIAHTTSNTANLAATSSLVAEGALIYHVVLPTDSPTPDILSLVRSGTATAVNSSDGQESMRLTGLVPLTAYTVHVVTVPSPLASYTMIGGGTCESTRLPFYIRTYGPLKDGGASCAKLCNAMPGCQGFTHRASQGKCQLHGSTFTAEGMPTDDVHVHTNGFDSPFTFTNHYDQTDTETERQNGNNGTIWGFLPLANRDCSKGQNINGQSDCNKCYAHKTQNVANPADAVDNPVFSTVVSVTFKTLQAITSECDTRGHALASLSTRGSWETTSYDVLAVDCKGNSCVTKTATASASQCAKMATRQQATSTYPTPRNPDGSWKISAKIGNFELKGGLNPAGTAPATPGFCRSTGGYTAFIARGDGPLFDGGIDCACKCEALPECQGFSWTGSRGLCNLAGSSFPTYHSPGATELNHPSHYTTEAIAKAYAEAADGIVGGSQPKGFGAKCLFEQGKEEYIRAGAWPNTKSHYGEFNMQYKDNAPGLINSLVSSAGYSCYVHKDQEQRMTAGTTEGSRRSRSAPAPDTDTDTCSTTYSLTELPQFVNVDVTHV